MNGQPHSRRYGHKKIVICSRCGERYENYAELKMRHEYCKKIKKGGEK